MVAVAIRDPMTRPLLLCGIVAPLLYVGTVIWGAIQIPGYSHLADPVSALTQAGRTGAEGIQSLFLIYNGLVVAYALVGISITRRTPLLVASFSLLLLTALGGILMWPFPMDAIGTPATAAGITHIVIAAIVSLGTMGAIGLAALASRRIEPAVAAFSAICLAVVFISGLLAALGAGAGWPLMGLLERITIGTFEVWMFAIAARLYLAAR